MNLNLGGGQKKVDGYLNVDIFGVPDIKADLNKKFPFENDSIDNILAENVLEHIKDQIHFLNECHRILKKGGELNILVPHYKEPTAYMPQHTQFFSYAYFHYGFIESFNELPCFETKSIKLVFTKNANNSILEFIPNLLPRWWERFFWVAGIRIKLVKQ